MCRKLTFLASFVFVLGLFMACPADAGDPNLVVWFEFEGNADDSSGNARHGSPHGALAYGGGVFGQAIILDDAPNDQYVSIDGYKGLLGNPAFSIAVWIKTTDNSNIVGWGKYPDGNNGERVEFRTNNGKLQLNCGGGFVNSKDVTVTDDEWHHVALTVIANTTQNSTGCKIYVDGQDDTANRTDGSPLIRPAEGKDFKIGTRTDMSGRWLEASLDDFRLYDRVLTPAEVAALATPPEARLSLPLDGDALSDTAATLVWVPGAFLADVNGHEVFLSDSFADVNSGAPAASLGRMSDTFKYIPGLEMGTVYYWRVHEVNDLHLDSPWKSEIWSFLVPKPTAWNESPADGDVFVDVNPELSWTLGLGSVLSEPYFGTSFDDVNDGTGGTAIPRQATTTYTPPGPLAQGATYYWRVDMVKADMVTIVKGPVWSFTTIPSYSISDPNLVGWWKMNYEGPGAETIAVDYSGHEHHGTFIGDDAGYVPGVFDEAAGLGGNGNYINVDGYRGILGSHAISITAWIKTAKTNTSHIMSWGTGTLNHRFIFRINNNRLRLENGDTNIQGDTGPITDDEWHHVAAVIGEGVTIAEVKLYLDGQDDTRANTDADPNVFDIVANLDVAIGRRSTNGDRYFNGLLDEVRLYNRVLSPAEVARLMDPSKAWNPHPLNREQDLDLSSKLTWSPGIDEDTGTAYTKHDVYFSTSFDDVNTGTVPLTTLTGPNEYTPPLLENYKYYYWRIDGVNAADEPYRGNVWSFKAIYDITQVGDPHLLAWYKLDGDTTDSSGYGRHPEEFDALSYTAGYIGQGLELGDFNDYAVYSFPQESRADYTVTAWAKANMLPQENFGSVLSSHRPNSGGFQFDVNGVSQTYRLNDNGEDATFGPVITGWVHLAVSCGSEYATVYYNGKPVTSVTPGDLLWNQYAIGVNRNLGDNRFHGTVDEIRVYDYGMSDAEILEVMRVDLALAWDPNPTDGETYPGIAPTLSWSPGDTSTGHYVSFGADDPCNLAPLGPQPQAPNSISAGSLDMGRTYYWAVDEADAGAPDGKALGRIWEFTTANYMVAEDFEIYDWDRQLGADANWVYYVWTDGLANFLYLEDMGGNGTGANVFVQTATVSGGMQAMRFDYDNDGFAENPLTGAQLPRSKWSKAKADVSELPSEIGSDWVSAGGRALSVWFYGDSLNDIEPMWVELTDSAGRTETVTYGDYEGEEPNHITEASWREWNIDLQDFNDGGVDLADVNSIALGFGIEGDEIGGGMGFVYFDDIRVYAPRCVIDRRSEAFAKVDYAPENAGGDCKADYLELSIMTRDWLLGDATIDPIEPNAAALAAWYEFELDATDSSGNGRDANDVNSPSYVGGHDAGYAIRFDPSFGQHLNIDGYKGILGTQSFSITAWIKTASEFEDHTIVGWGPNTGGARFGFRIEDADGFSVRYSNGNGNVQSNTAVNDDQWHYVAITVIGGGRASSEYVRIYVDGLDDTIESDDDTSDLSISSGPDVGIGWNPNNPSQPRYWDGQIDDLRIYEYALTANEVVSIGGFGTTYFPVPSPANISDDEPVNEKIINFKDFAELMKSWLVEELWPQ